MEEKPKPVEYNKSEKGWSEFRETGLLLIINQLLHIFGWAIVFEMDGKDVVRVYPARVKYRGFSESASAESYKKISKFMAENANDLKEEANS